MDLLQTTTLTESQKQQLFHLWNTEYPVNLSYPSMEAFEMYLSKLDAVKHFLYLSDAGVIQAWAFTFDRDGERWFAIILSSAIQGKGIGKELMAQLQTQEKSLSGWVVDHNAYLKANGESYTSPLGFYEKCGFTICTTTRLELEVISAVKIQW